MFRDDHEAALARIAALEAELAREREKDAAQEQRMAQLEQQLEDARAKLQRVDEELARHRFRKSRRALPKEEPPVGPLATARELPENERRDLSRSAHVGVVVLVAAIVVVLIGTAVALWRT